MNNAGIQIGSNFHWTEINKQKTVLDVNLVALFVVTKLCLPLLIKAKGRVVNIASIAGYVPLIGAAAYTASKHGVVGFSSVIRAELYPLGVDVVHIAPGFMRTPLVENISSELRKTFESLPEDVRAMYPGVTDTKISERFQHLMNLLVRRTSLFGWTWLQGIYRFFLSFLLSFIHPGQ